MKIAVIVIVLLVIAIAVGGNIFPDQSYAGLEWFRGWRDVLGNRENYHANDNRPAFKTAALSDVELTVKRLATTRVFAIGGIGVAGTTSEGERDFMHIMSQEKPIATDAFERLYINGNPQAKCYALCGTKKLNRERFKQLLREAKLSDTQVTTMRGCIGLQESFRDVARQIERGDFDRPTQFH